jgi:uncharacterized protein YbaP (TraB family)
LKINSVAIISLIAFLLFNTSSFSQEAKNEVGRDSTSVDSVWLWQIQTKKSSIFIAGEMHDHRLFSHEILSHHLAKTAYAASSLVFLEARFPKKFSKDRLSEKVTKLTWLELTEAIRKSVNDKQKETQVLGNMNPDEAAIELMKFVERVPNHLLLYELVPLLSPIPKDSRDTRSEIGFLKLIRDEKKALSTANHRMLENEDQFEMMWKKHCGDPSDAQMQVDLLLELSRQNFFLIDQNDDKTTYLFKNNKNLTAAEFHLSSNSDPVWKVFDKCSVTPRTIAWMERLKPEIEAADQPIMVVVGIGHVVGDTGLLALLCAEGYCKSRRITNAEEIQTTK